MKYEIVSCPQTASIVWTEMKKKEFARIMDDVFTRHDFVQSFWDSVEDGTVFDVSEETAEIVEEIVKNNPNIGDGI